MSFPLPHNMNPEDIRYMHVDAVIQGKDRNRIKYLDLEGRWVLSGRSIPYISSVFNHIEHLNYARGPLFDITEPALNAIGLVGWTSGEKPEPKKEKKSFVVDRPRVEVQEEAPEPREVLPHRTAGYGPEHHVKRKISLSRERSRSPSVSPSRGESPLPPYDKYATRYKRKDSITSYGIKYGPATQDPGYASGFSSGAPSPNTYPQDDLGRPPHRTPSLSPLPGTRSIHYDSAYDPSYLKRANELRHDELRIQTKTSNNRTDLRSRGRYSPGSQGQSDYSTSSEQSSPNKSSRPPTADEYLLQTYHMSKTYATGPESRERRTRSEFRNN